MRTLRACSGSHQGTLASGNYLSRVATAKWKQYRQKQTKHTVAIVMPNYSHDKCFTLSFHLTSVKQLLDRMSRFLCLYFCLHY